MNDIRQVLLKLNKTHKGNWDKIYQAIKDKVSVDTEDLTINHQYITIIDSEYPHLLKSNFKPPFVIFYEGDISLLEKDNLLFISGIRPITKKLAEVTKDISDKYIFVSFIENSFDRDILKIVMNSNSQFVLVVNQPLDKLNKDDEIIKYALSHNCLIITEHGFDTDPNDTDYLRHRLVSPFLYGAFITSSNRENTKINLLIEDVVAHNGNVFVLPEEPFENSLNNQLIRDGALIVDSIIDIDR